MMRLFLSFVISVIVSCTQVTPLYEKGEIVNVRLTGEKVMVLKQRTGMEETYLCRTDKNELVKFLETELTRN